MLPNRLSNITCEELTHRMAVVIIIIVPVVDLSGHLGMYFGHDNI